MGTRGVVGMVGGSGYDVRFRSGLNGWEGDDRSGLRAKTGIDRWADVGPENVALRRIVAKARPVAASTVDGELLVGTVVVDLRSPKEFAAGHVPGAVNFAAVPWLMTEIAAGMRVLLVTDEGREFAGAWLLAGLGYTQIVGWLEGGMNAWHRMGRWSERA